MIVEIFTDGACKGNPGPGGLGVILKCNDRIKEHSVGFRKTTNNRMELLAVIEGLSLLKTNKYPIVIYSDSKYVIDSVVKGWLKSWLKIDFKGKKNKDLWLRYNVISKDFKIEFVWVKGHNGHPENERCDVLAVNAALSSDKLIDEVYENINK